METTKAARPALEALGGFVAGLALEDVPERFREQMRFDLLDSLGCGIYGSTTPWSRMVQQQTTAWGGEAHSSFWGTSIRGTCSSATLANGTAAQSLEFDNSHTPLGLHLGCSVLPAAVAVAEKTAASGKALLTALIAGYEVSIRIRAAMDYSHVVKGFNSTGTCSGFGAAAAVGKLLGMDWREITHAMGIVGVNSVGLQAAQFSMAKRLMGPTTAELGLRSAFLARLGYTGTPNLLEAELGGFFGSFSDHYDAASVEAGLGSDFRIGGMGIKPYPSSHGTHAALDGAKELVRAQAMDPGAIREVRIKLPPHAAKTKTGWVVTDVPSALHDVRFTVAVMLIEGDFSVRHLTEAMVQDPRVQTLMRKVRILGEPSFGDALDTRWTGQITIELDDGTILESRTIWHPSGTPRNPLSNADITAKFLSLATPVIGSEQSRQVAEMVAELEALADVNELTRRLAA